MSNITEAFILVSIVELLKEIELWLKIRVHRFLKKSWGCDWWNHLPSAVRRNAKNRRKWTLAEIGPRRTLSPMDIAWLSMGDIIRVLRELSPDEWKACIKAENHRKLRFEKALRRVKSFRDYSLAHPKPRPISNSELSAVCASIERLPRICCPGEWKAVSCLLNSIESLTSTNRREIHHLALRYPRPDEERFREWLSCPELEKPEACAHRRRLGSRVVRWREHVVTWCADYDQGGRTFFGREE